MKKINPKVNRIYAIGNLELLNKDSIAIIGSRNYSEYGKKITIELTKDLVKNNIVIISGMANGIDSIAHNACIDNGGKTIAVLGSGFKNIYPKENEKLFYKILDNGGLVISEYPINVPVQKKNFPLRNRIISGLADAVLVIEATYRSGTSITARYAKEQNKNVFCIPNSIGNKNSRGGIELLKKGAILITNAYEIMKQMNFEVISKGNNRQDFEKSIYKKLSNNQKEIFVQLKKYDAMNIEELKSKINLNICEINQNITIMELEDIIEDIGMGKYRLKKEFYE